MENDTLYVAGLWRSAPNLWEVLQKWRESCGQEVHPTQMFGTFVVK